MEALFKEMHTRVLDSSLTISDSFYEGNEASQKMGRILKTMINVLRANATKYDKLRSELEAPYEKMANVHNKYYQKLGGKLGSGEYIAKDVEEIDDEEFVKTFDGVSAHALTTLQMSIPRLSQLMESPFPDSNKFAERVMFAHWITLLSVYNENDRNNVIKIISKYDVNMS